MSVSFIADVHVDGISGKAAAKRVTAAVRKVAHTSMFHGEATAQHDGVGGLFRFERSLSMPLQAEAEGLVRKLTTALRHAAPKAKTVEVRLLDADQASWHTQKGHSMRRRHGIRRRGHAHKLNPVRAALEGYLHHVQGTKAAHQPPVSLTRHVERALTQNTGAQREALRGIAHHDAAVHAAHQLPSSLMRQVTVALGN
jgi:hypothetical protein